MFVDKKSMHGMTRAKVFVTLEGFLETHNILKFVFLLYNQAT